MADEWLMRSGWVADGRPMGGDDDNDNNDSVDRAEDEGGGDGWQMGGRSVALSFLSLVKGFMSDKKGERVERNE